MKDRGDEKRVVDDTTDRCRRLSIFERVAL